MKEKEQSKAIQFFKTAEAKKDQKRKRNCSTFFEKRKENPSRKNKTMFCQNVRIICKKHFQKRIVKHYKMCFKEKGDMVKKAGRDICQKQIRDKRR